MSEGEYIIKLRCDGKVVLYDFVESLHDMEPGITRCLPFDCHELVELIITREQDWEGRAADRR